MKKLIKDCEHLINLAKEILKRDKFLAPVCFLFVGSGVEILSTSLQNDRDKEAFARMIKGAIRKRNAFASLLITESYSLKVDKKDIKDITRPSEHKDRQEVICAVLQTKDKCIVWNIPFIEFAGEVLFGEIEMLEDLTIEGRFGSFFG